MQVLCLRNYLSRTFNINRKIKDEFSKDSDDRELIYS